MSNDFPKYYVDEEDNSNQLTTVEAQYYDNTSQLMPIEEETAPLPTVAEQRQILAECDDLTPESQSMLSSLMEMNRVAEVLNQLRSTETQEMRRTVITHWAEAFIDARVRNNMVAENLKRALLDKLLRNVDNLDLDTAARILNDLHDVTNVDMSAAMSMINGGSAIGSNTSGGLNVTINNGGEGTSFTTNTLNTQPVQINQLKEAQELNNLMKGWSTVQLPKKKQE